MRAFIGIRIKADKGLLEIIDKLGKFKELRLVKPEVMHLNLKFLGDIDEEQAGQIKSILDEIAASAETNAFDLRLSNLGVFPDKKFIRVVWLGVESEPLMKLHSHLEEKLAGLGFMKEQGYKPHITLARAKGRPPEEVHDVLNKEYNRDVRVMKIELIKSTLTEQGPLYETIHEVELK
ncbi:MAG: RNA 2',3'-cyclic phosphodiesterase [DPANN group archaeon]|nr:RNA 2',3'-cyclic phosphodiesterase [DPANN group archaeon]